MYLDNEAVSVRGRSIFPEVEGDVLCVEAEKGRRIFESELARELRWGLEWNRPPMGNESNSGFAEECLLNVETV